MDPLDPFANLRYIKRSSVIFFFSVSWSILQFPYPRIYYYSSLLINYPQLWQRLKYKDKERMIELLSGMKQRWNKLSCPLALPKILQPAFRLHSAQLRIQKFSFPDYNDKEKWQRKLYQNHQMNQKTNAETVAL